MHACMHTLSLKFVDCGIVFCFGHNRQGRDLKQEMMQYRGNIGSVILKSKGDSRSQQWWRVEPWHWRPIPTNMNIHPLINLPMFPIPLKDEQLKDLQKVYSSLIQFADWLPQLRNLDTHNAEDDVHIATPENLKYRLM